MEKKEFKGTQGPWRTTRLAVWNDNLTIAIADTWDQQVDYPSKTESIANAKLIAAAPELLEALQKVYRLAKQIGLAEDLDFEEFDYIEAVINKATD